MRNGPNGSETPRVSYDCNIYQMHEGNYVSFLTRKEPMLDPTKGRARTTKRYPPIMNPDKD